MERFEGIQLARAFAALAVVYFHSKHAIAWIPDGGKFPIGYLMQYGFYGVDFFFAISGFVACVVAARGKLQPVPFVIKRAFRIYPLWLGLCLTYWGIRYGFAIPENGIEHVLRSLLLLPTDGYPILDVGWSLQHEIAFYAVVAIVVPLGGTSALAGVLIAGIILHFTASGPALLSPFLTFYPAFLAGVLAYMARSYVPIGSVLLIGCGCLMFVAATLIGPQRWMLAPSFFVMLIGFAKMRQVGRLGLQLGGASYSIYLLHPIVFYVAYAAFEGLARSGHIAPTWSAEPVRFILIAMVCVLSIAIWKRIEEPVTQFGHRLASRSKKANETTASASR